MDLYKSIHDSAGNDPEEANQEWSPWGRPGGGAPIKIVNSNNSNNSRSNDASQSDARLTPIDRQYVINLCSFIEWIYNNTSFIKLSASILIEPSHIFVFP